jgi:endogenous inhibitor of DNA gyrase (YacG/DUF329 family)
MPRAHCPICRQRLTVATWRPFCSERCQRIDLGRWLDGRYRIEGPPAEPPTEPRSDLLEEPQ